MAHHGSSEMSAELRRKLLGIEERLGATGQYPHGKLNDDDEGEIKIAIAADYASNVVRIEFGKPIAWMGLTGDQAKAIGDLLIAKAFELRGIK